MESDDQLKVQRLREETPGVAPSRIHFNNAGASLPPRTVVDATVQYIMEEAECGGYELAAARKAEIDACYVSIADMIGANSSREIALMDSATAAWQMAFYSIPFADGDTVVTTAKSYASNYLAFLHLQTTKGIKIETIESDTFGRLRMSHLEALLRDDMQRSRPSISAVCITHQPTNGGYIAPAAAIGRLCKQYGEKTFLLDACQTVGQVPIDVEEIGCHFLSATSRKYLRGPRGIGFLYVSSTLLNKGADGRPAVTAFSSHFSEDVVQNPWLVPPTIDLHSATVCPPSSHQATRAVPSSIFFRCSARRFERWEKSPALISGLKAAVDYYVQDVGKEWAWKRIADISLILRRKLLELEGEGLKIADGWRADDACSGDWGGIVTFYVRGLDPVTIKTKLQEGGNFESPSGESVLNKFPAIHVHPSSPPSTPIDANERDLPVLVRCSAHYYNTADEIEVLGNALRHILRLSQNEL